MASAFEMPPSPVGTKQTQKWLCDVCKVQCFDTMEEAILHEEECLKQQKQKLQCVLEQKEEPKAKTTAPHPFFRPQTEKQEQLAGKKRKGNSAAVESATTTTTQQPSSGIPIDVEKTKRILRPRTKRPQTDGHLESNKTKDSSSAKQTKKTSKATLSKTSSLTKSKKKTAHLAKAKQMAPIFRKKDGVTAKKLMEEQVAVQFMAQRRLAEKRQREQNRKRREFNLTTSLSIEANPRKPSSRTRHFPVPSHICSTTSSKEDLAALDLPNAPYDWLKRADLVQARLASNAASFSGSGQHTERKDKFDVTGEGPVLLFPAKENVFGKEFVEVDHLQNALCSILSPPPSNPSDQKTKLWADKYTCYNVQDDICGERLREVAAELTEFVEKWMVEREKANQRMAERQRALNRSHKMKKKRKIVYKVDDDIWSDSDNEESELGNLCLLTGPVGSGKSNLVYTVAKKCGCNVLEMNASKNRGAAAVRRTIEEATQSQSSIDMLKKQKAALFARQELVDSDGDDEDSDEGKGSSLSVILIDEVDNLFEEDGVSAFWTTLSDLRKKAKCPIFLTANSFPGGLSSLKYTHIDVSRPNPSECVPKIKEIIRAEGFTILENRKDRCNDGSFENIADLCQCDLRRICHELQLFACSTVGDPLLPKKHKEDAATRDASKDLLSVVNNHPRVIEVKPRSVLPNTFSLLTIKGTNFLSLVAPSRPFADNKRGFNVTVCIGKQKCPEARIMDDCTILAVCPPYQFPTNVDEASGTYRGTPHRLCLTSCSAAVTVHGVGMTGVVGTSEGSVSSIELQDGTTIAQLNCSPRVDFHFESAPKQVEANSNDDSEEEFEFTDSKIELRHATVGSHALYQPTASSFSDAHRQLALKLVEKGIDVWLSKDNTVPSINATIESEPNSDSTTLEALELQTRLASDGAFLDDCGLAGIPYLSGSCPGFGFDLTEDFPKCTNKTNKPPNEERLFTLGWKDDSYFFGDNETYIARTFSARERALLRYSELSARGCCGPPSLVVDTPEIDEEYVSSRLVDHDEDSFLPNHAPKSLHSLPNYLRNNRQPEATLFQRIEEDPLLERRKTDKLYSVLGFLHDFIFPFRPQQGMRRRCLKPEANPSLPITEVADPQFFLDYLPILRCMAVHERSAERVFQLAKEHNPDNAMILSNRKRSTRRSKELGRKHYMECIVPEFVWRETVSQNLDGATGKSPNEIGNMLAESFLSF